jgi:hypothetical protein
VAAPFCWACHQARKQRASVCCAARRSGRSQPYIISYLVCATLLSMPGDWCGFCISCLLLLLLTSPQHATAPALARLRWTHCFVPSMHLL